MLEMIVTGNLGRDAEVREHNGQNVINFSVAHTEKWTDYNGQKQERTTWVECAYWRRENQSTAVAQYLVKGQKVLVKGKPKADAYNDRSGAAVAKQCLDVQYVELLGSREDGRPQTTQTDAPQQRYTNTYGQAQQQAAPQQQRQPARNKRKEAAAAANFYGPQQPAAQPAAQQNEPIDDGYGDLPF